MYLQCTISWGWTPFFGSVFRGLKAAAAIPIFPTTSKIWVFPVCGTADLRLQECDQVNIVRLLCGDTEG